MPAFTRGKSQPSTSTLNPASTGDDVVASTILPSGVLKLKQVDADVNKVAGMNRDIVGNAFGLALVDEGNPLMHGVDYAYAASNAFIDAYNAPPGWKAVMDARRGPQGPSQFSIQAKQYPGGHPRS
jgi:hypothetical protein